MPATNTLDTRRWSLDSRIAFLRRLATSSVEAANNLNVDELVDALVREIDRVTAELADDATASACDEDGEPRSVLLGVQLTTLRSALEVASAVQAFARICYSTGARDNR